MGWTVPRTWITGEVVTAAQLNTHVRDTMNSLGPTIAGRITGATGAAAAGNGFSGARSSAGVYTITFSVAFALSPIVNLTVWGSKDIALTGVSVNSFSCITQTPGFGAGSDADFDFVAHLPSPA